MMKRVSAGFDNSRASQGGATMQKDKYQTLLIEYLELQKEFVSRKRKLQAAKQKRRNILAEVRFLRRRRKSFSKSQYPNTQRSSALPRSETEGFRAAEEERNQSTSETASPENCNHVHMPCTRVKDVERGAQQLHKERIDFDKKLKGDLVPNNAVGKRKISWFDQVPLKVE